MERVLTILHIGVLGGLIALALLLRITVPENEDMKFSGMYLPQKMPAEELYWNYVAANAAVVLSWVSGLALLIVGWRVRRLSQLNQLDRRTTFIWLTHLSIAFCSFTISWLLIPYWAHGIFRAYFESMRVRDFSGYYLMSPGWLSSTRGWLAFLFVSLGAPMVPIIGVSLIINFIKQKHVYTKENILLFILSLLSLFFAVYGMIWSVKVLLWQMD